MQTIDEAKAALEATKEVPTKCPITNEPMTKIVIDTDKAKKALQFMAKYAFTPALR